ncbi:DVU_1555 family C-GCAxxG-C-C protein [Anoxynatronum buryatiense]|uniref:C_GCAxxG_C_C family probable redox protein n=1 Tax=Anoxynatronum buryatiense TaxID=489973 RepID=A0AA45WV58_9CLOT|nr:DV_1555 family C-GCAxxG-C-C protein [Anoxynatronum buryatiense]SMP51883.1 C_GCAxxG_C_C family probable redox protein [Anoxynatronum buryatiense]
MNEIEIKMFQLVNAGFCCTQVMMKLALEEEEKENEDLIRAVGGLCKGIGGRQKTCGVLTGGIAIIGLYAGKGNVAEYPQSNYGSMVEDYINWFEEVFKSLECMDIIGVHNFTDHENNVYPLKCGDILVKSYVKLQEILKDYDYEYGCRE